jgi:hypothetical protein
MQEKFKPGIYRHFKGHSFIALFTAKDSDTQEEMVVYVGLYDKERGQVWTRPLKMFMGYKEFEDGSTIKRFTFIREN